MWQNTRMDNAAKTGDSRRMASKDDFVIRIGVRAEVGRLADPATEAMIMSVAYAFSNGAVVVLIRDGLGSRHIDRDTLSDALTSP